MPVLREKPSFFAANLIYVFVVRFIEKISGVAAGTETCSYVCAGLFDRRLHPTCIGYVGSCHVVWHNE